MSGERGHQVCRRRAWCRGMSDWNGITRHGSWMRDNNLTGRARQNEKHTTACAGGVGEAGRVREGTCYLIMKLLSWCWVRIVTGVTGVTCGVPHIPRAYQKTRTPTAGNSCAGQTARADARAGKTRATSISNPRVPLTRRGQPTSDPRRLAPSTRVRADASPARRRGRGLQYPARHRPTPTMPPRARKHRPHDEPPLQESRLLQPKPPWLPTVFSCQAEAPSFDQCSGSLACAGSAPYVSGAAGARQRWVRAVCHVDVGAAGALRDALQRRGSGGIHGSSRGGSRVRGGCL